MSIEAQIYALLTARAELTALVGNRIYPKLAAQGDDMPYVVFGYETEPVRNLEGGIEVNQTQITVQAWSRDSDEAEAVLDEVIAALDDEAPLSTRTGTVDEDAGLFCAIGLFDYAT